MSKTITYIIRSPVVSGVTQNDVNLQLMGLDSQYQYYDAELQGLYIPKATFQSANANSNFVELKAYGMNIMGRDNSKAIYTVGFTTLNNDYGFEAYKFRVENFNGKNINFKLETGDGSTPWTLNGGASWILVLRLTPVIE